MVDVCTDDDGKCDIDLKELKLKTHSNAKFINGGETTRETEELLESVKFFNKGGDFFYYAEKIHIDGEFYNGGDMHLKSSMVGDLWDWSGNIKGMDSKGILNFMIRSKRMFIRQGKSL